MRRHRIAAAIYNRLLAFEYSIACEILGRDRRSMVDGWYEFLPCRVERGRLYSSHGLEIRPEGTLSDLANADTILVAGWRLPYEAAPPERFLDALRTAHARGARLVAICTGAFALGHAGLLDGRVVTTHWLHAEALRRSFPRVRVEENSLYAIDRHGPALIATSAGCAAGLDLCLAIIREDFGIAVANTVARRMVAPVHRDGGQSQYAEATSGSADNDGFGPVMEWMVTHLEEPLATDALARQFGYSVRTFQRRFKDLTGLSPHQWLLRQRIARARELLESSDRPVEQVASLSGLGSAANLRKHLARQLDTTPRAYRAAFRASD